MAYSHYDRLSALDVTFLELESPNVHPLRTPDGGLDIERIRGLAEPAIRQ